MKNWKIKSEFKTSTTYQRSWGDCQENNNSPSAYYPIDSSGWVYHVMLNKKVVRTFQTKGDALYFLRTSCSIKGINKAYKKRSDEIKKEISKLNKELEKEQKIALNKTKQLKKLEARNKE